MANKVPSSTPESIIDRTILGAVERAVLGPRRRLLGVAGGGAVLAALKAVFPIERALAAAKEETAKGKAPLEKAALKVGFVPITCATPIIMAKPMGFYSKY